MKRSHRRILLSSKDAPSHNIQLDVFGKKDGHKRLQ